MISMPVSLCQPENSFRMDTEAKYHTPDLKETVFSAISQRTMKLNNDMNFKKHVY